MGHSEILAFLDPLIGARAQSDFARRYANPQSDNHGPKPRLSLGYGHRNGAYRGADPA